MNTYYAYQYIQTFCGELQLTVGKAVGAKIPVEWSIAGASSVPRILFLLKVDVQFKLSCYCWRTNQKRLPRSIYMTK